jgi:hypothetical protein
MLKFCYAAAKNATKVFLEKLVSFTYNYAGTMKRAASDEIHPQWDARCSEILRATASQHQPADRRCHRSANRKALHGLHGEPTASPARAGATNRNEWSAAITRGRVGHARWV